MFFYAKRQQAAEPGRHGITAVSLFRHAKSAPGCRSSCGPDAVGSILLAVLATSSESGDA
jgi:hypothetical protein